jgi:hypothetical protein
MPTSRLLRSAAFAGLLARPEEAQQTARLQVLAFSGWLCVLSISDCLLLVPFPEFPER